MVEGRIADLEIDRHAKPDVCEGLADMRVVVVLGARQVGKSTLVSRIAAHDHPADVITLDDHVTREGAAEDPTGFVARLRTPVVIDEVQRVPDLLLAIKQRVDVDRRPGQFLLTGSANLLTARTVADTLTGRAEYHRLMPFSQGELEGRRERFLATLFGGEFPQLSAAPVGRSAYAERIVAGGYPAAQGRSPRRRTRLLESYVDTAVERDLATIARVHDEANVRRLLAAFAATSASLVNFDGLSRDLGITANTLRAHADLLETLFLIVRLPAWHSNLLRRVVKAPKVHVTDSGLLCALAAIDARRIDVDGAAAGMAFETFAAMELLRQAQWHDEPVQLHHYRDKEKREVDLVIERRDGTVVGVEVKASATATSRDFRGLRLLRDKLGARFKGGAVLYCGASTVPFGDRLAAVPLAGLWR